jgi:hypothetical protein
MNISCPQLYKKLILTNKTSEIEIIKNTLNFLTIASKFKVKKMGINTYSDPDLATLHKGWPFQTDNSVFTTNQYKNKQPVIWLVCSLFNNYIEKYRGGCGNHMQHSLPTQLYTGIYIYDNNNKNYILKEI